MHLQAAIKDKERGRVNDAFKHSTTDELVKGCALIELLLLNSHIYR